MAVDVIMPQMGESIFEGTITKWLKKAGDKIERDEPLFEISTDKVDAEIPSPSAGVLKEIKVNEGQTVPIQTVVAIIDADGAAAQSGAPAPAKADAAPAKSSAPAPAQAAPAPAKEAAPQQSERPAPAPATGSPTAPQKPPASAGGEKVRSSPLVRRIAREHDVDLTQVPG
ncbi:MAG: biotin/lipoyl-containing protein, partial [Candidatus Acidiferrales bacterium]